MSIEVGDLVKTNFHERKSEDSKIRKVTAVYPVKCSQTRVFVDSIDRDNRVLKLDSAWYTLHRKKSREYQTNDLSSFMG